LIKGIGRFTEGFRSNISENISDGGMRRMIGQGALYEK
jgi:hypothetical protein